MTLGFLQRAGAMALALIGLLALPACDEPPPNVAGDGDGDSDAWFEIAQGDDPSEAWVPLEDGDPLFLETGGQGLIMFALPVRAGGFPLPDDPKDYGDPTLPKAEVLMDLDDAQYNTGIGGHFFRLVNYPLTFDVLEDGTYEFYWITVFPPDEFLDDVDQLHGLEGTIDITVTPHGMDAMTQRYDVVIDSMSRIDDPPPSGGPDCTPGIDC